MSDEATAAAVASPVLRPHLSLCLVTAIAVVAQPILVLGKSIVNVALPAMKSGPRPSLNHPQWVASGYLITVGGLLLLAACSMLSNRRRS